MFLNGVETRGTGGTRNLGEAGWTRWGLRLLPPRVRPGDETPTLTQKEGLNKNIETNFPTLYSTQT